MMVYENRFNVYMNAYGDDRGGGGSNPNGPSMGSNPNVGGEVDFSILESQYKFTDPPRYYKANDPYYYEIDNIPLKQLHENCLWLRDQMSGGAFEVSGVETRQITDLKPSVSENDRLVRVSPGKFIGRVNSVSIIGEGGDNIGTIAIPEYSVDISRETVYLPHLTKIEDGAWRALVGASIDEYVGGVGSNGLFAHYQHHQVFKRTGEGYKYQWAAGGDTWTNDGPIELDSLAKIQTAVWRQLSGLTGGENTEYMSDARLLATDFCRKWGGVFRTSVVSVEDTLAIQVPEWSDEDFTDNHSVFDPQVRIDLVFVYTKPIDSTSDDMVTEREGDALRTITGPALGLVKGAGGILSAKNNALDITSDPGLIGGEGWVTQENDAAKWYDTSGGTAAGVSINSPLSNQTATTNYPIEKAPTYSFPSPDDLMNLAPVICDTYLGSNFAGVGQSVLPLCYVIVKKDQAFISDADIIDIRPFLRTTELTYNERAGVGGANPPLSLANPAVGKTELYEAVETVRNYVVQEYGLGEGGTGDGGTTTAAPNPEVAFVIEDPTIGDGNSDSALIVQSETLWQKLKFYGLQYNNNAIPVGEAGEGNPVFEVVVDGEDQFEVLSGGQYRVMVDLNVTNWTWRDGTIDRPGFWTEQFMNGAYLKIMTGALPGSFIPALPATMPTQHAHYSLQWNLIAMGLGYNDTAVDLKAFQDRLLPYHMSDTFYLNFEGAGVDFNIYHIIRPDVPITLGGAGGPDETGQYLGTGGWPVGSANGSRAKVWGTVRLERIGPYDANLAFD